jgi:hypothetical protein
MVPGWATAAAGSNTFDMLTLQQWVEEAAPGQIVASHGTTGNVDRTRPLCRIHGWLDTGTDSIDDAALRVPDAVAPSRPARKGPQAYRFQAPRADANQRGTPDPTMNELPQPVAELLEMMRTTGANG